MIPQDTVSQIFEKAIIEEVVGDFVALKKRGANLIGLCPFHNEKTPSFNVSPSKGIYKCFGCGKGGNAVNFIMEHEHCSYPEALKQLAKRYGIEIEEREQTAEEIAASNERESLFIVNEFANTFFRDTLMNSEEGRSIGLSYFKERGFREDTMEKFALGYCPNGGDDAFTPTALRKGYKREYLIQTGLTKEGQHGDFDFYRGRVIFPIRNLSGKTIGFGGRTLSTEKKIAKYFNSPESKIYHKSDVLYGLFESKTAIVKKDMCFLVEGYTDVISMHQSGVENVVASSGTALSNQQIRAIQRYTPNITVIFDGDAAGVKASFRGIDMLLEEGMKVRAVALEEGEDPDSLAKRLEAEELVEFLTEKAQDFFEFKTDVLLADAGKDPIRRSKAIHEIISSLALFPDKIERNLKTIHLSQRLRIDQDTLLQEIRKAQRKKADELSRKIQRSKQAEPEEAPPPPDIQDEYPHDVDVPIALEALGTSNPTKEQEDDILRILLLYGAMNMTIKVMEGETEKEEETTVERYIVEELVGNMILFKDPINKRMFDLYQSNHIVSRPTLSEQLLRHPSADISSRSAELVAEKHELHDWNRHNVEVTSEENKLDHMVHSAVNRLKLKTVQQMISDLQASLNDSSPDSEELIKSLKKLRRLDRVKVELSEYFGNAIL